MKKTTIPTIITILISWLELFSQSSLPENQILFFRSNNEGSAGHLFIMNSDGSKQVQVGRSGARPDHYPNWSPDGEKITFESYRQGGWRIWVMDRNGNNARRLNSTGFGTGNYEFDPVFNEDGSRVVYFGDVGGGADLFEIDITTGQTSRITNTPGTAEFHPDVSLNGDIAFVSSRNEISDISVIDSNTGIRTRLTDDRHKDLAPKWSPDGKEILFYSDRDGGFQLFIMDKDGENIRRLLSDEILEQNDIKRGRYLELNSGWNVCLQYKASFSPDGKWITFSANTIRGREIFIASLDGQKIIQITDNDAHDGFPMFSPVLNR